MSNAILLAKNVDAEQITYGAVKSLDSGGRSVYVAYKGKPLILQTPELSAPFGVSKWSSDRGGADKHTCELSFKGREEKESIQKFYGLLEQLDAKFVQDAMENSMNWLKKKYNSTEVVQALYTPMVKHPKDKETGEITDKYPPTFRLSLPYKDGTYKCDTYDKDRNPIQLDTIIDQLKGSKITAIIQCLGLWIAGGKFGCSWKVLQLKVAQPNSIRGFAFQDEDGDGETSSGGADHVTSGHYIQSSDDDDIPPPPPAPSKKPAAAAAPTPAVTADSDAEEEEEIEEEDDPIDSAPPPPPPVSVKTVTVKKPAAAPAKKTGK